MAVTNCDNPEKIVATIYDLLDSANVYDSVANAISKLPIKSTSYRATVVGGYPILETGYGFTSIVNTPTSIEYTYDFFGYLYKRNKKVYGKKSKTFTLTVGEILRSYVGYYTEVTFFGLGTSTPDEILENYNKIIDAVYELQNIVNNNAVFNEKLRIEKSYFIKDQINSQKIWFLKKINKVLGSHCFSFVEYSVHSSTSSEDTEIVQIDILNKNSKKIIRTFEHEIKEDPAEDYETFILSVFSAMIQAEEALLSSQP